MVDDITKLAKRALELDEFFVEPKYMCGAKELIECREILPQLATAYLELKEKYDELEARYQEVKANDGWKSIKDTEFFNSTASGDTGHPTKKDPK